MDKEWYFNKWLKGKVNSRELFLDSKLSYEIQAQAEDELKVIRLDDEIHAWIEKYLDSAQTKKMNAAYRKHVSRSKTDQKRIADTIELPYDISFQLAELAQDKNVTKRQYFYDLVEQKYREMQSRQAEERMAKLQAEYAEKSSDLR